MCITTATATQTLSHFVSGLDLSVKGDVRGPYKVGPRNGLGNGVRGYFGLVPAEWQGGAGRSGAERPMLPLDHQPHVVRASGLHHRPDATGHDRSRCRCRHSSTTR